MKQYIDYNQLALEKKIVDKTIRGRPNLYEKSYRKGKRKMLRLRT